MAIDDEAVLLPAIGHYYLAPATDQALPVNLLAPGTPYVDLGHTSLEDPFGLSSEGGDVEVKGTWQNPTLRSSRAPRVDSIAFIAHQWDLLSYQNFWGSNAARVGDFVQVPLNPVPNTGTLYVVIQDGNDQVAIHAPKVELSRADDIELSAEDLGGLPLRATLLGRSSANWLFQITPKGDLTAP